jgi:hypothetical protein
MKMPGGKTRSTQHLSLIYREVRQVKHETPTIVRSLEPLGGVVRRIASAHSYRGRRGHPFAGA